ncbi:MAG: flagellar type III secretion system pore protein FliP [Terricaulis sp.]
MKRPVLPLAILAFVTLAQTAWANTPGAPEAGANELIRNAVLLTALSLGPAIFISMTSFVRIAVVLAMVRHAFGMPETPPNSVLVSLALLLSAFVMAPTFSAISANAVEPFMKGEISVDAAIANGAQPLKQFMLRQVRADDLAAVYRIAKAPLPRSADDVDILKLTPAFILNELRASFTIGFVILLPFLLIEIVVASILLALGMMMVPPSTISLPIKMLMFVLIDGWSLVIEGVVGGFR